MFVNQPQQSQPLALSGIVPPSALSIVDATADTDAAKAVRLSRKRSHEEYKKIIKSNNDLLATNLDRSNAEESHFGTVLAGYLPALRNSLHHVDVAQIVLALQPQFDQIQNAVQQQMANQNATTQARWTNSLATRPADAIVPMMSSPMIVDGVLVMPQNIPEVFPQTRENLFALGHAQLNILLNYYRLPVDGLVGEKMARLANHLGLPPRQ
jgi:hypothetical protein